MADIFSKDPKKASPAELFKMGEAYFLGQGVEPDLKKAVELWRKTAKQGYPQAHTRLGVAYFYGRGVKKNLTQALAHWQKAYQRADLVSYVT
jgi:TPR repeat protein